MPAATLIPIRSTLAGRWQGPALLVGIAVFAGGIVRAVNGHHQATFEEHLERAEVLRRAGALTRLNAYLLYLLKDSKRPAHERGEFHRLLVHAIHAAEAELPLHNPDNIKALVTHFDAAVALGVKPGSDGWAALGDAHLWAGRLRAAVDAYREALRHEPVRPDDLRRRLVEVQSPPGSVLTPESLGDIDAVLMDGQASPANYTWAVERSIQHLLNAGEAATALGRIHEARERLKGTPELPTLRFLEALCLRGLGRADEADALVRSILANWETRDELWGRSGWLLGVLELEDGRPQAAMAHFEDVLAAFTAGPLHDACELGRAQALVALERPERALEIFRRLRDGMPAKGPHAYVSRDVVRTTLTTIGRSLIEVDQRVLGADYLSLALAFAGADADDETRGRYLALISDALRGAARRQTDDQTGREASAALYARAAEAAIAFSKLPTLDPAAAAQALEDAADDFDRAGLVDRMIDVLDTFVTRFPKELVQNSRARVLYRLGRAYQARGDDAEAAATYEQVIREYPRQPEALSSLVPRAASLIRMGGESARRGESLLIEIVDDRGADPIFTPSAQEYRDALVLLAESYLMPDMASYRVATSQPALANARLSQAVTRLEDALLLYPDDPARVRLTFLLAEAYRQSAAAVAAGEDGALPSGRREADERRRRALENYDRVKAALAGHDAAELTSLEQTYLRAAYANIGDCLFDLGDYERAVEAYRETAWRYENEPAAVVAMMQVVACYDRLNRAEESAAALARMRWLLKKIPDEAFASARGMSSKQYWHDMVSRLERTDLN